MMRYTVQIRNEQQDQSCLETLGHKLSHRPNLVLSLACLSIKDELQ
jgi:hypothetical protein